MRARESDPAESPGRRAIVAVAVAAVTIDAALLGLIAPLLPDIEARTGAGDAALGLALAAYAVPIALLSLPLGRAADAIGRRPLLVAGLVLVAAGSALIAISDSIGLLMTARVVQGVGSAASWIAALALVSDTAQPGKRGEALGVALGGDGGRLDRRPGSWRSDRRRALVRGSVSDLLRTRDRSARCGLGHPAA